MNSCIHALFFETALKKAAIAKQLII